MIWVLLPSLGALPRIVCEWNVGGSADALAQLAASDAAAMRPSRPSKDPNERRWFDFFAEGCMGWFLNSVRGMGWIGVQKGNRQSTPKRSLISENLDRLPKYPGFIPGIFMLVCYSGRPTAFGWQNLPRLLNSFKLRDLIEVVGWRSVACSEIGMRLAELTSNDTTCQSAEKGNV